MNIGNHVKKTTAIVAVTKKGVALGSRLQQLLADSHLYVPLKYSTAEIKDEHRYTSPVKDVVNEIFDRYRYLVLIMATGIAVRAVAPVIKDKRTDPGVVVIDDSGSSCISLLSGHLGGANELAEKIASMINAHPVITTASDINKTISADMLGSDFGWILEENEYINAVSSALVNGESVGIFQEAGERNWRDETEESPDNIHIFESIDELAHAGPQAAILITDRVLDDKYLKALPVYSIIYRPKSLVIGIGCNRGTTCAEIEAAVCSIFQTYGLSVKSIRNISTITIKKNETGILEFAEKYGLPVEYFGKEVLCKIEFPSSPSETVLKYTGTPSVCESAAIISSGSSSLIVPKTSHNRKVTIAIARLDFNTIKKRNRLFLVGIGPGSPDQMTFKAREAIESSDTIVGYNAYIDLIRPLINGKEVITTGMGAEVKRVKTAIDLALSGKTVSLVSSGDSGIYGMAGLAGEILHTGDINNIDIQVIPGVPVLAAGAALLGAPLNGDFAAISLSDYLVTWQEIAQRLRLVAQSGLVLVIYNPVSKKRQLQFVEAIEIIRRFRGPDTSTGIVQNAYRNMQKVIITDVQHILEHTIDMNTIIFIGTSHTFVREGWMVTPRGYAGKYDLVIESQK